MINIKSISSQPVTGTKSDHLYFAHYIVIPFLNSNQMLCGHSISVWSTKTESISMSNILIPVEVAKGATQPMRAALPVLFADSKHEP